MKKRIPPLIIDHHETINNLYLLSMIEYNRQEFTCIIDNITNTEVKAFVLDNHIAQQGISPEELISEAIFWYYDASAKYQFSMQLAKRGLSNLAIPFYKTFAINNIARVVGRVFYYPEHHKTKVKRKRVLPISEGIEIHLKRIT